MGSSQFYEDLQRDLVQWAADDPDIRCIMQVGSMARQVKVADEYSDLDLLVFVADSSLEEDRFINWMRAYAPIWMTVLDHHDETWNWLIMYRGGIKVDFQIIPVSELEQLVAQQELWSDQIRGYKILLDKDSLAAKLPPPKPYDPPAYTPPTQEEFTKLIENFFYGAIYVAKQIKRENLWKVKWADQMQQSMLLRMLEWHAHAISDDPIDTYYRGDFMRDWVSNQTWDELHHMFSHFDAQDSRDSLLASITLFIRLAKEASERLQYDYPEGLVQEVGEYLQSIL